MAGAAKNDYEELTVVQSEATLEVLSRYALPGLRHANKVILERVAAEYSLSAEPEIAHPEPFEAPSLHLFGGRTMSPDTKTAGNSETPTFGAHTRS